MIITVSRKSRGNEIENRRKVGLCIPLWERTVQDFIFLQMVFIQISEILKEVYENLFFLYFERDSVTEEEAVTLWMNKAFADKETRKKEMERAKV